VRPDAALMAEKTPTRTINVIEAAPVKHGTSANGKDWTLYEITATAVDGTPIDEKLKSFEQLAGDNVEVEIERQEHEKYGVSYMLKRAGSKSPGARLGPKVDEIRDRVEELERKVDYLLGEMGALRTLVVQATEGAELAPAGERSSEARFGGDDDIPF
jgi:hypothetical protein